MKYLLVFCFLFVGCATKAEFTYTEKGFKIECGRLSACEAKQGDVEVKADTKFNLFEGLATVYKGGI